MKELTRPVKLRYMLRQLNKVLGYPYAAELSEESLSDLQRVIDDIEDHLLKEETQ